MTVPLSDAVASKVPVELMAMNEMGDLCAWMTFTTVSVRVSKSRTSPESEAGAVEAAGRVWAAVERGEVGDGTGEGYARKEGSDEGDRAHIAVDYCEMGRSVGVAQPKLGWALTVRVLGGINDVEETHVADIVYVDLRLQHDDKCFAVEFHG